MIHDLLLFIIYFSLFAGSSLAKSNMYSGPHTWPEDLLHQHVWALRRLFRKTEHSLHYYQNFFSPCTERKTKLLFSSIFGNQCDMVGCRDFCSAYFPPRLGHKKWRLGWWSPFALTVLAPINLAWITFAEFTKSRIEFSRKIICMQICLEVNNR